jgi:hypothetical protein
MSDELKTLLLMTSRITCFLNERWQQIERLYHSTLEIGAHSVLAEAIRPETEIVTIRVMIRLNNPTQLICWRHRRWLLGRVSNHSKHPLELGEGSRHMTNKVNAPTMIDETPRMIESAPPVVLALVNIFWRTTAPFVRGYIHGGRFAWCRDEGVVDDDLGGIDVLPAMDAAIHLLETLARRELLFSAAAILDG